MAQLHGNVYPPTIPPYVHVLLGQECAPAEGQQLPCAGLKHVCMPWVQHYALVSVGPGPGPRVDTGDTSTAAGTTVTDPESRAPPQEVTHGRPAVPVRAPPGGSPAHVALGDVQVKGRQQAGVTAHRQHEQAR